MENLNPTYKLVLAIKMGVEASIPLKIVLQRFIKAQNDSLSQELAQFLILLERGRSIDEVLQKTKSIHRQFLYQVILRGLRGEPILEQVNSLEAEVREACRVEIETFAASLPMKALIPLLFLQFPAFLMLLLGPFLFQLVQSLK